MAFKNILVLKNDLLLEIRKELGLTQVKMAELLGVSIPTYCYWEVGKNNPQKDSIDKIAIFLEKHASELKEKGLPCEVEDLFTVKRVEKKNEADKECDTYFFLGFKLKKLRQDGGFSQEDYATLLRVFYATISKWERGASFCKMHYGKKIAKSFGIEDYMEFYALKEDVYSFILSCEIPLRYVNDFKKEGLLLEDNVENPRWDETALRNLESFKVLKLYRYFLGYDV